MLMRSQHEMRRVDGLDNSQPARFPDSAVRAKGNRGE